MMNTDIWIFGYGSLIWDHADLGPIGIVDAKLIGAHRSFNKKSTINRGTKSNPGLALGLEYGGTCIGKALLISQEAFKLVQSREVGYGEIHTPANGLSVETMDSKTLRRCVVFMPNKNGKNYINPDTTIQQKADIIKASKGGTRGTGKEYLSEIRRFLNEENIRDNEVEALHELVFLQ